MLQYTVENPLSYRWYSHIYIYIDIFLLKPPWTEGFPSHVQLIFSQRSIEQILGVIVLHASATGTPSVTPPLCDVARPGPSGERSPGPMQLSMLYPGLPVTCILGTFRNADTSNCASGLVVSNLTWMLLHPGMMILNYSKSIDIPAFNTCKTLHNEPKLWYISRWSWKLNQIVSDCWFIWVFIPKKWLVLKVSTCLTASPIVCATLLQQQP